MQYQRDGYYFPVDMLTEGETRELREKLEAHERAAAARSRATGGTSRISISPS